MPEYLSPGVYVEEVPSGARPIQGVSTSTAGFVGQAEREPTRPRLVTSWGDYQAWFGDLIDPGVSYLPFSVRGFFENGGQRLYVARITRNDAVAAELVHPTADTAQRVHIRANGPGDWGNRIFIRVADGTRVGIRVTILYYAVMPPLPLVDPLDSANIGNANRREPTIVEDYDNLDVQPTDPDFFIAKLNSSSQLLELEWDGPEAPAARPNDIATFAQLDSSAGVNGVNPISADEYCGDNPLPADLDQRTGLAGLAVIDEISILSTPDDVLPTLAAADQTQVVNGLIDQCERQRDRFAVLNAAGDAGDPSAINLPRDSSYGAFYHPWVRIFDSRTDDTILVPPSGHVCGIYARTDMVRGVHKAPANEIVRGIVNRNINDARRPLGFTIGEREHDILNPRGVNVIRDFRTDRRGIRVWGARTMSSNPEWRYVNVRRLLIFIEKSIDEGTRWVVFEPNDASTWAKLRRSVGDFLLDVWRSGALHSASEEEAFFVRCDRTTMTQADIDFGRLICEIRIAPVKPAEFVIFRIVRQMVSDAS